MTTSNIIKNEIGSSFKVSGTKLAQKNQSPNLKGDLFPSEAADSCPLTPPNPPTHDPLSTSQLSISAELNRRSSDPAADGEEPAARCN